MNGGGGGRGEERGKCEKKEVEEEEELDIFKRQMKRLEETEKPVLRSEGRRADVAGGRNAWTFVVYVAVYTVERIARKKREKEDERYFGRSPDITD